MKTIKLTDAQVKVIESMLDIYENKLPDYSFKTRCDISKIRSKLTVKEK